MTEYEFADSVKYEVIGSRCHYKKNYGWSKPQRCLKMHFFCIFDLGTQTSYVRVRDRTPNPGWLLLPLMISIDWHKVWNKLVRGSKIKSELLLKRHKNTGFFNFYYLWLLLPPHSLAHWLAAICSTIRISWEPTESTLNQYEPSYSIERIW